MNTEPFYQSRLGTLYLGDFTNIIQEISPGSIDCIYTDPPYGREYSHLYRALADNSSRVLKMGGNLMTICPHYLLPEVIEYFNNSGLKWRWINSMLQITGQHPRMAMGIEVCWKPILWYVKGAYPSGRGFLKDLVEIHQPKKIHKWQQDESWADYYIPRLSTTGVVLDPMMGTGTVAVVCERLGIRWIGIESDRQCCEVAVERLEGYHERK